jgi:hypothetical protein
MSCHEGFLKQDRGAPRTSPSGGVWSNLLYTLALQAKDARRRPRPPLSFV